MQASRPAGEDRLPWLEPYREDVPARKARRRSRSRGPLYAGALALLIGAAGTGYWLGQRDAAPQPRPQTRASDTVPLPPVRQQPADQATQVAPAAPAPSETIEPVPPPKVEPQKAEKTSAAPVRKKAAASKKRPRKKIRSAGVESQRLSAVRSAQERSAAVRHWPRMPSPGPAGQVIQLGAFSTPARANAAYRTRIARYPALQRMPRVVVPIVTGRRNKVLYVLRLGTSSRQHSHVVCRNLRASGDHCIVIG